MNVRLDVVVSAVAAEAGLDPDRVSQDALIIKRFINDTRLEIYGLPVNFSSKQFVGEIVSVANVTAGSVSVTQNKAEVTGSSTSFSTAMAGRYIQVASGQWQRISYVTDTTHLTLEASWNDSSQTGASYKIWKRYYPLPPKVAKIHRLADMSNPTFELAYYDPAEFRRKYGYADSFSDPVSYTQYGTSDLADAQLYQTIYTSVIASTESSILTFSGTSLVTAMAAGDKIILGNSTTSTAYYVDKVLTDTQVALRSNVAVSGTSYSATAQSLNRLHVQFYPAVDSSTKIFAFEADKAFYDLTSNSDLLESGWYNAVKKGAVAKAMGYVRDPRETQKLAEYEAALKTLMRDQFKAKNPAPRLKPAIVSRYGNDGVWMTDRDVA